MKEPTPIVTDTDRQRGWAEIEIELLDGTRQFVRVHALDQSDLVHLAKHPAADALNEAVAKSLRADKAFVARISQHDLVAVSATLAFLTHGDVAGDAIVSQAATSVFESSKSIAQSALAEMMDCGKSLRDQLAAKALDKLDQSMKAGEAQANQTADAIRKMAEQRIDSGDLNLTPEAADAIDKLLTLGNSRGAIAAIDSNTRSSFFMSESEKAAAVRERMNALDRDFRYSDANRNTSQRNAGQIRTEADRQREINRVQDRSRQVGDEYTSLKNQGLMSQEDFDGFEKERQIDRMNSLAEIKNQMTELQQMGQQTTRMFASGFSQAFVDFASGAKSAKEAFSDFARSFLSSVAQMIMEQLILNAISGIFGGGKNACEVSSSRRIFSANDGGWWHGWRE